MSKNEFLRALEKKLSHLPKAEIDERINFYSEMIDDRMESGLSEAEAVAAVGSADRIAHQIARELDSAEKYDVNTDKSVENSEKKKMQPWVVVLLVLGSPIWLSLGIAGIAVAISLAATALAVVISIFAAILSIIVSLWAVFGALVGSGIGITAAGIYLLGVKAVTGVAFICVGLVCLGLSILFFFACKAITNGIITLTKNIFTRISAKKGGKADD